MEVESGWCIELDGKTESTNRGCFDGVMHVHPAALLGDEPCFLERLQVMAHRGLGKPNRRRKIARARFVIWLIQHERDEAKASGIGKSLQPHSEAHSIIHRKARSRRQRCATDRRHIIQNGKSFRHDLSIALIRYMSNKCYGATRVRAPTAIVSSVMSQDSTIPGSARSNVLPNLCPHLWANIADHRTLYSSRTFGFPVILRCTPRIQGHQIWVQIPPVPPRVTRPPSRAVFVVKLRPCQVSKT